MAEETITCPKCDRRNVGFAYDDRLGRSGNWVLVACPDCGSFPHQVR